MEISKFSKKQAEILKFAYSDEETIICDGAVRSGKTIVMSLAFVLWAMHNFDRTNFAICGKTVSNAERNILRPFQQIEGTPFTLSYKISNRMLTVKCGKKENYFYLFGGKDESSYALIQGLTLAGVLFDEVALMPKSFVDQAIARTLSFKDAKIWFNCNPESPHHWFYKEWIDNEERKYKRLHFLMEDNPIMGKEEIAKAEEKFTGVFYQRYILGLWVQAEGLVYPFFEKKVHCFDILPDGNYEWYVSVDYGTQNPCAMHLWAVDIYKNIAYLEREYYYDGREEQVLKTDSDYYKDLFDLCKGKRINNIIIDPSAASFKAEIRKHGYFSCMNANNAVIDGIRNTASFIKAGKIRVNKDCEKTISEFGVYAWDAKSSEDKVIKENDHAMDSIRYMVHTVLRRLII